MRLIYALPVALAAAIMFEPAPASAHDSPIYSSGRVTAVVPARLCGVSYRRLKRELRQRARGHCRAVHASGANALTRTTFAKVGGCVRVPNGTQVRGVFQAVCRARR